MAAFLDAPGTSQRVYPHVIRSHWLFIVVPVPGPVGMGGVHDL